jgi:hypothetical protein
MHRSDSEVECLRGIEFCCGASSVPPRTAPSKRGNAEGSAPRTEIERTQAKKERKSNNRLPALVFPWQLLLAEVTIVGCQPIDGAEQV